VTTAVKKREREEKTFKLSKMAVDTTRIKTSNLQSSVHEGEFGYYYG
jgi:hypothetical protein